MNTEFFHAWRRLLVEPGARRVGAPQQFPEGLFGFLAYYRARSGLDYRGLEELCRLILDQARARLRAQGFSEEDLARLSVPHFTQIRRRVAKVMLPADVAMRLGAADPIYLLLDVDGPKVATEREWIRVYVGLRVSRGWFRLPAGSAAASGPVREDVPARSPGGPAPSG